MPGESVSYSEKNIQLAGALGYHQRTPAPTTGNPNKYTVAGMYGRHWPGLFSLNMTFGTTSMQDYAMAAAISPTAPSPIILVKKLFIKI